MINKNIYCVNSDYKDMRNFEVTVFSSNGTETCQGAQGAVYVGQGETFNLTCGGGVSGQYVRYMKTDPHI